MTFAPSPGPWRLDHERILSSNGDPVCLITDPDTPGDPVEWPWMYSRTHPPASYGVAEDNAHLIAAAPDLLDAAEAALYWLENEAAKMPNETTPDMILDVLQSAIAKATANLNRE